MKTSNGIAIFVLLAAGAVSPGPVLADNNAEDNTAFARLIGYQEVVPLATHASGTFVATVSNGALAYQLTYQGLEGAVRQAHIHFGQKGVNGGISVFLCQTSFNPDPTGFAPTCPQSGTVTGVITGANVIGPAGQDIAPGAFDELIRAMKAGVSYANVHSLKFPGGEVRGQINFGD
jgi:hypothetical protein